MPTSIRAESDIRHISIVKTIMRKNYNYMRQKLYLPEYGRHIHEMIDSLLLIENRAERTRQAKAVIAVMGNLNPLVALLRTTVIVVAHSLKHSGIERYATLRHNAHITHDRFVVGVLVVELIALRTHKACYAEDILLRGITPVRGNLTHHLVGILAVVLESDTRLGILQLFGL